jgi:DNA-binding NtrC family response regulator
MLKVLYLDDNAADAEIARVAFLQTKKFTLENVSTCEQARERLLKSNYDLLITDIVMPGVDGVTFVKELRLAGNDTPFVLTSGAPALASFKDYTAISNYVGFAIKPITPDKLETLFMERQAAHDEKVI